MFGHEFITPVASYSVSKGVFQSSELLGDLLVRYPTVFTASGQSSAGKYALMQIAHAFVMITPTDLSADSFYCGV